MERFTNGVAFSKKSLETAVSGKPCHESSLYFVSGFWGLGSDHQWVGPPCNATQSPRDILGAAFHHTLQCLLAASDFFRFEVISCNGVFEFILDVL